MITARVDPIGNEFGVAIAAALSPAAASAFLAAQAARIFAETDAANARAIGEELPHIDVVDGVRNAALVRVRPDGVIVRSYDLMPALLHEIGTLLFEHSPVLTGAYQASHRLLADGSEIWAVEQGFPSALPPGTREFVFVPTVPYARRIEPDNRPAWSKKAPEGVYMVVAKLMRGKWGRLFNIQFTYRAVAGMHESARERTHRPHRFTDMRQPAIVVMAK